MKWRGQGLLVVALLAGATAVAYQWKSFEQLQDQAIGYGINYTPYTNLVDEFVDREKRWPEPGEIDFSTVAEGGVITNAELQKHGEILFTLSAWTIKNGYAQMSFAPTLNVGVTNYAGGRLSYNCVEVIPANYEAVICRSQGKVTRAEVATDNDGAFTRWQHERDKTVKEKAEFAAAVASAETTRTLCDDLWLDAQQNAIPCAEGVNPALAKQIQERSRVIFNGPRLAPETIARNPESLVLFNRECEENWRTLVALAKINDESLTRCF